MSWFYSAPTGVRRYLKHITKVLFPSITDIVVTEFGFSEPFESNWVSAFIVRSVRKWVLTFESREIISILSSGI